EREPPAHAEDHLGQREPALEERPADDLVHRVVAAHVLAEAQKITVGGEEAGRMEPAGHGERGLGSTEPLGKVSEERERSLETALELRGLHCDGVERALAAHPAGGARVEAPLDARWFEAGGFDLDRVRGEVARWCSALRLEAFGETEAERELLVVSRRPHGDRNRPAADPDRERLLD